MCCSDSGTATYQKRTFGNEMVEYLDLKEVQRMLGYTVIIGSGEKYPFLRLRAYLRHVKGPGHSEVRVNEKKGRIRNTKSIEKCSYCKCIHWRGDCPMCGR